MADIITQQKLSNLDRDIADAGKALNTKATITPRYGASFKSLPMAVQEVIETGGFEPFQTEAQLLASSPTLTKKASYALDTHKIWLWVNGAWSNTGLSQKEQAEKAVFNHERFIASNENMIGSLNESIGFYIDANGVFKKSSTNNWAVTDYFSVKKGDFIKFIFATNSSVITLASYDIDKNFLGSIYKAADSSVIENVLRLLEVTDSKVAYVRACYYKASTVTIPFLSIGKSKIQNNRIDTKYVADVLFNQKNLFNPLLATENYYLNNNVLTSSSNWVVSDYIAVNAGESYTSNTTNNTSISILGGIHYYNENKELVNVGTRQISGVSISIPQGVSYIRLNANKTNTPTDSIQIVRGDFLPSYIPAASGFISNVYKNKILMTLGDSITDSITTPTTYPPIVAKKLEMTLIDGARSGRRIRDAFIRTTIITDDAIRSANVITIAHGTNDFKLETPLGTIDDAATSASLFFDSAYTATTNKIDGTFYSDYKGVIERILSINLNAKIMLIAPIRRTQAAATGTDTNAKGFKLKHYADAVKNIGEYYGLPVLDNFNTSGFNDLTIPSWTTDGLHPTPWAQENVVAVKVINFLTSN